MLGMLMSLKKVMTGKVIRKVDTKIMGESVTISLRLKESSGVGDGKYVVMAVLALGNYKYYAFDLSEFDEFVRSAKEIRNLVNSVE